MKTIFWLLVLLPFFSFSKNSIQLSAQQYEQKLLEIAPFKMNPYIPSEIASDQTTQTKLKGLRKDSTDSQRILAADKSPSDKWFEEKMSEQYKNFISDFLKVTTSEELDLKLVFLQEKYEEFPPDLKFLAAQLIPLRKIRGLVWRMIPLFPDSKILHSFLVTFMKTLSINMNLFMPQKSWRAGFDYLTQPFAYIKNGKEYVVEPFTSEVELQAFVSDTLDKAFQASYEKISQLTTKTIVWDNRILFGLNSFINADKAYGQLSIVGENINKKFAQYSLIGEAEILLILSGIKLTQSQLALSRMYSFNGFIKVVTNIGKDFGFDSLISEIDGVPPIKRNARIKEVSTFGLYFSDSDKYANKAFQYLKESLNLAKQAWGILNSGEISDSYLITKDWVNLNRKIITFSLENYERMLNGPETFISPLTGESITINLPAFFKTEKGLPIKWLADLLPTNYSYNKNDMILKELKVENKIVKRYYRNYSNGEGNKWNYDLYRILFPSLKNSPDSLKMHIRVLSHIWGGAPLGFAFMIFVN